MDPVDYGGIGGTFGGNPVCCAAGLATLKILKEKNLATRAQAIGDIVMRRFKTFVQKYPFIGEARGLGAMNALEIVLDRGNPKPNPDLTKAVVTRCYEKGLILLTAGGFGNVIRHLVPLIVTDKQREKGLDILAEALAEMAN
jgi:4-aminobutyrate aminotransferase/(S)-3-amino-2-methylpropionate transaminase